MDSAQGQKRARATSMGGNYSKLGHIQGESQEEGKKRSKAVPLDIRFVQLFC